MVPVLALSKSRLSRLDGPAFCCATNSLFSTCQKSSTTSPDFFAYLIAKMRLFESYPTGSSGPFGSHGRVYGEPKPSLTLIPRRSGNPDWAKIYLPRCPQWPRRPPPGCRGPGPVTMRWEPKSQASGTPKSASPASTSGPKPAAGDRVQRHVPQIATGL